ncbi:hypothetical protein [Methylobacterium haplocladii]|uniref:hypothetical protein n=1 Tax=Methylobacterium haplocladii TaxID=1176176 RepID=UPI00147910B4|nr:hypothetical protein [Methylobacterium haplocladii]
MKSVSAPIASDRPAYFPHDSVERQTGRKETVRSSYQRVRKTTLGSLPECPDERRKKRIAWALNCINIDSIYMNILPCN